MFQVNESKLSIRSTSRGRESSRGRVKDIATVDWTLVAEEEGMEEAWLKGLCL